jgi:interferon, gamma-inducible protein 30
VLEMRRSRNSAGRLMDVFVACAVVLISTVHVAAASTATEWPLVSLDIYYETLCPDSVNFIVQQLHPTLQKIGNILNVSMIPFGIASVSPHTLQCRD